MAAATKWNKALPFLAVGRVQDAVALATQSETETTQQKEQTEEIFGKLLNAARQKLKPGQRTRLQWNDGSVCCLMDQQGAFLYCLVTAFIEYPERFAYQLLQEFMGFVQQIENVHSEVELGLNEALRPRMRELLLKYEDPGNFDRVQQDLDRDNVVKSVMRESMRGSTDGKNPQGPRGEAARQVIMSGTREADWRQRSRLPFGLTGRTVIGIGCAVFIVFVWKLL